MKPGGGSQQSTAVRTTDWTLCFLCQENQVGKPLINLNRTKDATAQKTAMTERPAEFGKYSPIPMGINLAELGDGSGVTSTLRVNNAQHHKSCYLQISNEKLMRAKKRHSKEQEELI